MSDIVDDESDDNHDGSFYFIATMPEMKNVNDKSRRVLSLPPLEYRVICSNDAEFTLDPENTNGNLLWEKVLLPNEAFPIDLNTSKCYYFEDPRGQYALLVCVNISSDAQIKDDLLQDKTTFHQILLENHPDKQSNPKYHDEFKVANNKWEMVNVAYNMLGMSDDVIDFHLHFKYNKLGESLFL